jgi:16S rRNA (guanine527-N7)-methyltransferase
MSIQSDLETFAALLRKWNAVQNLVSRETLDDLWPRHIEDSLQLLPLLRPTDQIIVDMGSGGGFPAIPLAIASRETSRRFILLEPITKKAAFLRTVARELSLAVQVHAVRAEDFASRETAGVITSRALAPLPVLLGLSGHIFPPEGHMLLLKGMNYRRELDAAAQLYDFDVVIHLSRTDPGAAILEISKLRAKSAA